MMPPTPYVERWYSRLNIYFLSVILLELCGLDALSIRCDNYFNERVKEWLNSLLASARPTIEELWLKIVPIVSVLWAIWKVRNMDIIEVHRIVTDWERRLLISISWIALGSIIQFYLVTLAIDKATGGNQYGLAAALESHEGIMSIFSKHMKASTNLQACLQLMREILLRAT